MAAVGEFAAPILLSSAVVGGNSSPKGYVSGNYRNSVAIGRKFRSFSHLYTVLRNGWTVQSPLFSPKVASSASVGSSNFVEEPATNVKFLKLLNIPGCSSSLSLLGTGYRERVFAIIGVKVYAAALYVNRSIFSELSSWKGQSAAEIQANLFLFQSIYQAPLEKSLQIALVRDIDGKTFWAALDEAVSPRVKQPAPTDESALSTFRDIFHGRPLKKGTLVFLTWLHPSKLLVSVSSSGQPARVDATIESMKVTRALFDVFFGDSPVSPSLKASIASGLAAAL
ncbi:hypothetical protein Nepgr_026085 [Nepenthes gracilis]|uniref:Chalcone-flavonone isomerase family protein n=1 Tax=Nepenthes gracilis TaxID=150966 RepID=A0AAD3T914_NEPGR|nr:hypothetical protein Nepgr_026085 [Nepenthes gracilis]